MKALFTQLCPALCNPMDCSPSGSSVHGILQTRILEWVAILFSRESSWPRDQTRVSCIAGRFFTVWATREAQGAMQILEREVQNIACKYLEMVKFSWILAVSQSSLVRWTLEWAWALALSSLRSRSMLVPKLLLGWDHHLIASWGVKLIKTQGSVC